jgi:hypothetical protein
VTIVRFPAAAAQHGALPWFDVHDYGATGDGSTDDTAAVQVAVNAASVSGGVVLFAARTYVMDTVYINADSIALKGAGVGVTTLKRRAGTNVDTRVLAVNSTGPTDTVVAGTYRSNITIADMTVDGNNANVTNNILSGTVQGTVFVNQGKNVTFRNLYILNPWYVGLQIRGCLDADADNITVDGMLGDYLQNSIHVEGDAYSGSNPGFTANVRPSTGIRIRSCRVVRNYILGGGIGICVQGSSDVSITTCEVDMSGGDRTAYGILLEGGGSGGALQLGRSYVCADNVVRGCHFGISAMDTNPDSVATGILDGITIADNEVVDTVQGITLNGRNGVVSGNRVSADVCLSLGTSAKASIEGNYSITGNTLVPQAGSAIDVSKRTSGGSLTGLSIVGNIIDAAASTGNADIGIHLAGAVHGFTINGNIIRNTPAAGIYLEWVASDLVPAQGRIIGNELINVVRYTGTVDFPYFYGIVSSGCTDVLVALNHFVNGVNVSSDIASENTGRGVLTLFGNTVAGGGAATDESNASARIGGTITGSRGGNAALANLLTGLVAAQIVKDTTT